MEGVELDRALGVRDLINQCYETGWTGADLKEFVGTHKREHFDTLDHFADGALSEMKTLPSYPVMLELTAIRYALEQSAPGRGIASVKEVA